MERKGKRLIKATGWPVGRCRSTTEIDIKMKHFSVVMLIEKFFPLQNASMTYLIQKCQSIEL